MSIRKSVSCLICNNDSFLIFKRHPDYYTGWGMIKGGIEAQESPERAMIRELHEETGLEVTSSQVRPLNYMTFYYDPKRKQDIEVTWFLVTLNEGQEPTLLGPDHEWVDARWCTAEQALAFLTWQTEQEALKYVLSLGYGILNT